MSMDVSNNSIAYLTLNNNGTLYMFVTYCQRCVKELR